LVSPLQQGALATPRHGHSGHGPGPAGSCGWFFSFCVLVASTQQPPTASCQLTRGVAACAAPQGDRGHLGAGVPDAGQRPPHPALRLQRRDAGQPCEGCAPRLPRRFRPASWAALCRSDGAVRGGPLHPSPALPQEVTSSKASAVSCPAASRCWPGHFIVHPSCRFSPVAVAVAVERGRTAHRGCRSTMPRSAPRDDKVRSPPTCATAFACCSQLICTAPQIQAPSSPRAPMLAQMIKSVGRLVAIWLER
jgi:hypothetical protein